MKIVVGQGSCGIAAGAGRVYDALAQALSGTAHELTIAGCIGMCYLEPIVDIMKRAARSQGLCACSKRMFLPLQRRWKQAIKAPWPRL